MPRSIDHWASMPISTYQSGCEARKLSVEACKLPQSIAYDKYKKARPGKAIHQFLLKNIYKKDFLPRLYFLSSSSICSIVTQKGRYALGEALFTVSAGL